MGYVMAMMALAAGDQWLKGRVEAQGPEGFPRPLRRAKGKIWLYRNHNPGFPFGFLKKHAELVRTLPLVVTSALAGALGVLLTQKGHRIVKVALAMILGGSMSNLYDRYVRHYVVDYFSLRLGPLKKVVFNLGDIFIFMGTGLLFAWQLAQEARNAFRPAKGEGAPVVQAPEELH